VKFLGSKKDWFWFVLFCVFSVLFIRVTEDWRIPFCVLGSAMMLFSSFVFILRILSVIILNKNVYENVEYRNFVEKLQKDGCYKEKLYMPLILLDGKFSDCFCMCYVSIALFLFAAFIKIEFGYVAIVYMFFVLDCFCTCMLGLTGNILFMIGNWQDDYETKKVEGTEG